MIAVGGLAWRQSLHFLINDGLMTIFFLLVGLEIRRELHEGALSNLKAAALPLMAAVGGIIAPALIYLSLAHDPHLSRGWAIPTATDIAFAMGVLALLGKRVPPALRALLLALAIIDDIAAILVIAFFYSGGIAASGLFLAACGVAGVIVFQRVGIRSAWPYVMPGLLLWFGMLKAGIHPTLAGVVVGLLTPVAVDDSEPAHTRAARALKEFRARLRRDRHDARHLVQPVQELQRAQRDMLSPVVRVETALHPWVAYGIMPLFALANAGVTLAGLDFKAPSAASLGWSIGLALCLGKPLGIFLVALISVRSGLCALPATVTWRGIILIACLGGVGFTMSVFIAALAFPEDALLATAKFAVLGASVLAALTGLAVGKFALPVRSRISNTVSSREGAEK